MRDRVIKYIKDKYDVNAQHPWEQYPEHSTFKELCSGKWFALIMPVEYRKLGIDREDRTYVINLKARPDFISMICGVDGYLPAYHMNKRHWLTLLLDGTVSFEQVAAQIDESYMLISDTPTKRIYEAVKKIPKGYVATYGMVAELAGNPKMARAVGNALHKNPDPDNIPCFRVVNSKGELAEGFAFGGAGIQEKLLIEDGVEVVGGKVDLDKFGMKVLT